MSASYILYIANDLLWLPFIDHPIYIPWQFGFINDYHAYHAVRELNFYDI